MKTILKACLFSFLGLLFVTQHARAELEFEQDSLLPVAYLNLVVDSGALHDPEGKSGLAQLAGQMILRGTQKHSKVDFNEKINGLGGFLEVDVRNEGTVIQGGVLSENLPAFLELVTEALTKPRFTAEELIKLKKETVSRILEEKGNDRILVQQGFYKFFYGDHPYGKPVLGTQKSLTKITGKDIASYYDSRFGKKTIHLFGTGDAKKSTVEAWFEDLTEKLNALHPTAMAPIDPALPKFTEGRRSLIVDKPKATQSQVLMGSVGFRPENPDFYAIMLANHSFGGASFQARMMQEIRVKRGWTYGAYNSFKFGKQPRHFAMYFFPKTADTVPAIELAIKLFEDFRDNGITKSEYDFARSSLVNNAPFNYDNSKKRLENAVTEYLMGFPKGYNKDFADNIQRVSFDSIAPALKRSFNPDNLSLTVVGDAQALTPAVAKLPKFSAPHAKNYLEE